MKSNQGGKRTFFTELLFWLHLPIVLLWFGLFFVPRFVWPSRVSFHFWFIVIIMLLQLLWGIFLYPKTKKIDFICPLTTWLQHLRGYEIKDQRNYNHSFIAELLERLHIKISFRGVNILLFLTLVIVVIQYALRS